MHCSQSLSQATRIFTIIKMWGHFWVELLTTQGNSCSSSRGQLYMGKWIFYKRCLEKSKKKDHLVFKTSMKYKRLKNPICNICKVAKNWPHFSFLDESTYMDIWYAYATAKVIHGLWILSGISRTPKHFQVYPKVNLARRAPQVILHP